MTREDYMKIYQNIAILECKDLSLVERKQLLNIRIQSYWNVKPAPDDVQDWILKLEYSHIGM